MVSVYASVSQLKNKLTYIGCYAILDRYEQTPALRVRILQPMS